MNKTIARRLVILVAVLSIMLSAFTGLLFALTPQERSVVEQAQSALRDGMKQYGEALDHSKQADKYAAESDRRAQQAEKHAKETDDKITPLQKQIDDSHKNEQKLADRLAILEPEHKKVHSWLGVGGIIFGFTLLIKHLLWFSLFAGLTVGALYIASFFFPVIGVGLKLAGGILGKGGPIIKKVFGALRRPLKRLHDAIERLTARMKTKPTPQ